MSDSIINNKHFSTFTADEIHRFEQLLAPSVAEIALYQKVINNYHKRLIQHWVDSTNPPERIPSNRINPPDIAAAGWSRKMIYSVICNYGDFLQRKGLYKLGSNGFLDPWHFATKHWGEEKVVNLAVWTLRENRYLTYLRQALEDLDREGALRPFEFYVPVHISDEELESDEELARMLDG